MRDADSLIPAGSVTTLAIDLDRAMSLDASARDAYLAMWGTEWQPLTSEQRSYAVTTTLGTVR